MKEFINHRLTGKLFYDQTIFQENEPILFTCKDENNQLYLCVEYQCDSTAIKWLVKSVTKQTLIKMLTDQITIREAFLQDEEKRFSICKIHSLLTVIENSVKDWADDSLVLPTKGEYLEIDEEEFQEILKVYQK